MSIANLANRLSDLGRREDALAAAEEAVHLHRALAEARPDAFAPGLALSLDVSPANRRVYIRFRSGNFLFTWITVRYR
jgi:hypothetical protein